MIWKLLLPILAALSHHSYFKPSAELLSKRPFSAIQQYNQPKRELPTYASLEPNIPTEYQKQKVRYALTQFIKTPGFDLLVKRMQQQRESTIMGTLYELEAAIDLEKKGFEIVAFNQTYKAFDHICEIDIVATDKNGQRCYIECKDISWSNCPKVKNQLLKQQAIIKELEEENGSTGHMLCSKRPIPPAMRDWLRNQNIRIATS